MAKIKFGAMITDARGKLDGIVYSKSRYGSYARRKVSPVQPLTAAQSAVRDSFGGLSKAWSNDLTDLQRTAWADFAAAYPVMDVFGNSQVLTGISFYQRVNRILAQVGEPRRDDPPADQAVTALTSVSAAIVVATTDIDITFDATPLAANHRLYVMATPRINPAVNFFKNALRFIASSPGAQVSPFGVWAEYEAVFGPPVVGSKIGFLVATVNVDTGAMSVGTMISAVAA